MYQGICFALWIGEPWPAANWVSLMLLSVRWAIARIVEAGSDPGRSLKMIVRPDICF